MKRRLSAGFWASCRDPNGMPASIEKDIRYAVAAWCLGMLAVVIVTSLPEKLWRGNPIE